jgi:hypothetical protein
MLQQKKMENRDSGIIGKKKVDFKVYEKIYELFLPEEGEEFLFARCFLTLEWNLMARFESIVHAHFFHVMWEDDCLAFHFAKSKMDQMGRNRDQVWHVHARQNNAYVCPVPIPVSQTLITSPRPMRMAIVLGHVFPGGDQNGQFMVKSMMFPLLFHCPILNVVTMKMT